MNHRQTWLWGLALAVVVLLCGVCFVYVDKPVAIWMHGQRHTLLRRFFNVVTNLGESQWYLVPGLVLFIAYRKSRAFVAQAGLFLFTTVAASGLSTDLIKYVLGRARPSLWFEHGFYGFHWFHGAHAWSSFPSGHATTAFSAALALALLFPRHRWTCLVAAAAIAISRVVLTHHYVGDILAGAYVGALSTMWLYGRVFRERLAAARSVRLDSKRRVIQS